MAGTGVGKFSSTAGSNTSNLTVNFAENMAPSNVNNAARELMGHIRDMYEQLGDGYFEFGDGDGEYTVARSDADTITITSSSDISSVYFAGRKIRITDGGSNVVEGTIASSSHTSTTQTVNLTGISLASGTPTKVELGVDTAAFGGRLILDDDGDTYIEAPTDDTIDIYLAGAKDFVFTANTFTAESGSTIAAQALTATTITASGIVKTDDTTNATTTTDGSLQTDGGLSVALDAVIGDDLFMKSDSSVIHFGADSEITLTHVADTGLVINSGAGSNTLQIQSTDAGGSAGPILKIFRNSTSPADDDITGNIKFAGQDSGGNEVNYAEILTQLTDVTDGDEDVRLIIKGMVGGNFRKLVDFNAGETVFNDDSDDVDFRVESNANANMFVINAGTESVNIGTTTGNGLLNVVAADGVKANNYAVNITNSEATAGQNFGCNIAGGTNASDVAFNVNNFDSSANLMRLYGSGKTAFPATTAFGVGTDSPGAILHVDNSSGGVIRVSRNGTSTSNFMALESDGTNGTLKAVQQLIFSSGGNESFRSDVNRKLMSNGETASNTGEGGLCLNQAANDDEIMTFKSSDVAHGITVQGQTDDFLHIQKVTGANGGVEFKTFSEDQFGAYFTCCATDANTTTSASASGPFIVQPHKKDGTGIGSFSDADANLFLVANSSSINFLIKADGEIFSNQSATVGTYDTFEDAQLVRSLELSRGSTMTGLINSQFDKYIKYNHETLAEANLVGRDKDGTPNHMVNITGMQRLHNGAIWQQYEKTQRLVNAVYELAKVAVGEEKANEILKQNEIKLLN